MKPMKSHYYAHIKILTTKYKQKVKLLSESHVAILKNSFFVNNVNKCTKPLFLENLLI